MPETLRQTNLGLLSPGDMVNLEQPLALGGRLGGHLVQGHIDTTGRVAAIIWGERAVIIRFEAPPEVMRYVREKSFIAVDGISLTVATRDTSSFRVSVVDYTLKHTTLDKKQESDLVNLEVDIIAKYVEQLSQTRSTGITVDFLEKHGFLVS
jgi:riboflavin synthase